MGERVLTGEQLTIIHEIRHGRGHVLVEAGAGCAKTSTLVEAAQQIRVPTLAVAFNKRIAEELAQRMPSTITVKTFNGMGHGVWARHCAANGIAKVTLDDRKVGKIVSSVAREFRVELVGDQWDGARELVRRAQQAGLVPAEVSDAHGLVPDSAAQWADLDSGLDAAELDMVIPIARETLVRVIVQARAGVISFDDQVYCPVVLGGKWPTFMLVMVDERQDLSELQIEMIGRMLHRDGRLVVVGDRRQGIYAWRGATDADGSAIRGLRPNGPWTELPLMTTFRCPQRVVERQQVHVPGFRAWDGAAEGRVWQPSPDDQGDRAWGWLDIAGLASGPTEPIALLCRNNAPLMTMAFRLIRAGVGVEFLGREIGRGLTTLAKKLAPEPATPTVEFLAKLRNWAEGEIGLVIANDRPERVAGITDRRECLMAVAESTEASTVGQIVRQLDDLFARANARVTLASVHKAKGLEWPVVIVIDPWRFRAGIRKALDRGDEIGAEQERNCQYVAETRAQRVLGLVNLDDWVGTKRVETVDEEQHHG